MKGHGGLEKFRVLSPHPEAKRHLFSTLPIPTVPKVALGLWPNLIAH